MGFFFHKSFSRGYHCYFARYKSVEVVRSLVVMRSAHREEVLK